MAIQKVINHIYNGRDYDVEHAQTGADMVIHEGNKLSDFLQYMLPFTGGIKITGSLNIEKDLKVFNKLMLRNFYANDNNFATFFFDCRNDKNILFAENIKELILNHSELKAGKITSNELGFYQQFSDGTEVKMDGRGGPNSSYNIGWYFSNAKGAFVDLYAKNVQNQSDARVKNILPITKDIKVITDNAIENITPKRFKYFSDDKIRYGFIAQEIEKFIPEAVNTVDFSPEEEEFPIDKFGNKMLDCKFIDPIALIATLWQEVKVLKEEIKVLKGK